MAALVIILAIIGGVTLFLNGSDYLDGLDPSWNNLKADPRFWSAIVAIGATSVIALVWRSMGTPAKIFFACLATAAFFVMFVIK
jgi:hypothetical protein